MIGNEFDNFPMDNVFHNLEACLDFVLTKIRNLIAWSPPKCVMKFNIDGWASENWTIYQVSSLMFLETTSSALYYLYSALYTPAVPLLLCLHPKYRVLSQHLQVAREWVRFTKIPTSIQSIYSIQSQFRINGRGTIHTSSKISMIMQDYARIEI